MSEGFEHEVDGVLARYGLARTGPAAFMPEGVLNRNFRVATASGDVLVKFHRPKGDLARLEVEALAMRWCQKRGIPVPLPLVDMEGRRFDTAGAQFTSVYPWVEGRHAQQGSVGIAAATLLGDAEGRIHAALEGFPADLLSANTMGGSWDTAAAVARFDAIIAAIERLPYSEENAYAAEFAAHQRSLLLAPGVATDAAAFSWLPRHPVFGDFHSRNVIIDNAGDSVVAVIDWEMVCLQPPLYELLRALQYADLKREEMRAWIAAYGRHRRYPEDVCRASVEFRWQAQLHGAWALQMVYLEGDQVPAQFFANSYGSLRQWSDTGFREWLADVLVDELRP